MPLAVLLLVWAISLISLPAMTVNLARPYESKPASPRPPGLAFYAPGCDDFLFDGKQDPQIVCVPYLRALNLEWTLAQNRLMTPFLSGRGLPRFDNSFDLTLPGDGLKPGFYDLRVTIHFSDTEKIEGITTFGWKVDEMPVYPLKPDDFDIFWKTALQKIDAIPPNPKWTLEKTLLGKEIDAYNIASAALPEDYDPEGKRTDAVEIYRVHFTSHDNVTIEGWFTKPVGPGPFPALLVLPGAGNIPRPAPVEQARHGYAALDIQVHGNLVDAPAYAPLPPDNAPRAEDRIHYDVYLNALQAARVLKLLPGVDSNRMAVLGGSQGGRLTMVVAALDPSFKAAIAAITHFAYMPWQHWVQQCNTNKQSDADGYQPDQAKPDANDTDRYYDVLNFTPLIRCPVLMNSGLIDPTSPPTSIFALYDALPGKKELIPLPNTGHDWSPAFDRYAWRWLDRTLTAPAAP